MYIINCQEGTDPKQERTKNSKFPLDTARLAWHNTRQGPTTTERTKTMAATYKQNANLFEFIAANFPDIVSAAIDAKGYALTPEDVAATATKQAATANRPKVHKPSVETKRNRAICDDILVEFNARNGEFTAAEVANMTTDPEGIPMTTRKVAALLSQMVKRGELAKSPEKWSVAHYALPGYEFAPKPARKPNQTADETNE